MFEFDPSPARAARRSFLGRMAGGAAVLLAGRASVASAEPIVSTSGLAVEDEWIAKILGQYRQFFDATAFNDAFPVYYAFNWAKTIKDTYKATNPDVTAVIGLRHMGIAPAFKDVIWQKYKLGEFFKINDPKTKAPATRNFLNSEATGDVMFAGSSIAEQVKNGAVVTVCNLATTIFSGLVANAAGLKMKPEDAYKEWKENLLPGAYLVPSGVLAVHRAQSAGKCTYCYAGV